MSGSFSRVSLLVQVPRPCSPNELWTGSHSDGLGSRILIHETVHYWQQLSQGFLLLLAAEEWRRLDRFEREGTAEAPGVFGRRFAERKPPYGLTARDLSESLAHFWELVAIGPHRVIESEWAAGRRQVNPDHLQAYRRTRQSLGLFDAAAWGAYDLYEALFVLAGPYADPLRAVVDELGAPWMFLYPWLAHFALTTTDPARMFAAFVDQLGTKLAREYEALSSTSRTEPAEFFEYTMNQIALPVRTACAQVVAEEGGELLSSVQAYEDSGLAADPVYRWVFAHQVLPAVHALMDSATVRAASHHLSGRSDPERRFAVALEIMEGALATPGLPDSRRLLLLASLVPPCVRSASGEISSFAGAFRSQAQRHRENLSRIDLTRNLLVVADVPGADERDHAGVTTCLEVQERWERFIRSR